MTDGALFTALVLAGDRGDGDPLLVHTGQPCKALVPVGGRPVIHRVLDALEASESVAAIYTAGPAAAGLEADAGLAERAERGAVHWRPPGPSPATSAHALMTEIGPGRPFLLTTADHPFLDAATVDGFCRRSLELQADVTLGLAPHALVREAFPQMKKTVLRFSDGEYCGCNLFAFPTAEGVRAAAYWRGLEQQRKRPLQLIRRLGWWSVLRYWLGRLPLDEALARLSRVLGLRVKAVILENGHAAVDVDSVDDYRLVCDRFES